MNLLWSNGKDNHEQSTCAIHVVSIVNLLTERYSSIATIWSSLSFQNLLGFLSSTSQNKQVDNFF